MKEEVISFKVDAALAEHLKLVPNRSDFIRKAILQALDHECPLCQGTGILSADGMNHWKSFTEHHHLHQCDDCNGNYLSCDALPEAGHAEHNHS